MNRRVFWAFCCTALIQTIYTAPPPVSSEVNPNTSTIGIENALTNTASGDVILKKPGLVGASEINNPNIITDGPEQVGNDHVSQTTTPTLNGNISANAPNAAFAASGTGAVATVASSSSSPAFISATINTPSDNEITFGSGTSADLPLPDPTFIYKMILNMLRRQEQFMPNQFSGLTSSNFPSIRIPQFQIPQIQIPQFQLPQIQIPQFQLPQIQIPPIQMPQIQIPPIQIPSIKIPSTTDPLLKLVDQQKISDGGLQGEIKTYEGQLDPNTMTKMQTSQFSLTGDGIQGTGQQIVSQSTSASGNNPVASVSTFFSGIPNPFNVDFPMFRFS